MTPEAAEELALKALAHLASEPESLSRFLEASGAGAEDLRGGATDTHVLAGVLDYVLSDERLLLRFCEAEEIAPELPRRARAELPGFAEPM